MEEESDIRDNQRPGSQQTEKETVGLTPELVKVTIAIPNSYFEKVWRERNPAAAGQEPKAPDQAALEHDPHRGIGQDAKARGRPAAAGQGRDRPDGIGHHHHLPGHQAGRYPPAAASARKCSSGWRNTGARWA